MFPSQSGTVEGAGFRHLYLGGELGCEVLENNAIGSREEGQDVLDEVPLGVRQLVPILVVL